MSDDFETIRDYIPPHHGEGNAALDRIKARLRGLEEKFGSYVRAAETERQELEQSLREAEAAKRLAESKTLGQVQLSRDLEQDLKDTQDERREAEEERDKSGYEVLALQARVAELEQKQLDSRQAVDILGRQRDELEQANSRLHGMVTVVEGKHRKVAAEVERLRAALERIEQHEPRLDDGTDIRSML